MSRLSAVGQSAATTRFVQSSVAPTTLSAVNRLGAGVDLLAQTLVSRDDAARVVRKIAGSGGLQAVRRSVDSLVDGHQRVVDNWSAPGLERQWFDVPAVQRRWAKMISGDADVDFRHHVAVRFLFGSRDGSVGGSRTPDMVSSILGVTTAL